MQREELDGDASCYRRFKSAQEGIDYVVRNYSDLHGHTLNIVCAPDAAIAKIDVTIKVGE